jgi:hypothetical protein
MRSLILEITSSLTVGQFVELMRLNFSTLNPHEYLVCVSLTNMNSPMILLLKTNGESFPTLISSIFKASITFIFILILMKWPGRLLTNLK